MLDLSFNNLETTKTVGTLPANMSALYMASNKLTTLSKQMIDFVPKLSDFNVENNRFNNLPAALAKTVAKRGPRVSFKGTPNSSRRLCRVVNYLVPIKNRPITRISHVRLGNPIECDCTLIPIKRMLNSKLAPDPQWTNMTCVQLLTSEVAYVSDLSESELICDVPVPDDDADAFAVTPDVKFREIKK